MTAGPFAALVAACSAVVREDAQGWAAALEGTDDAALYAAALRHRCAGVLLAGCERFDVPSARWSLVAELEAHCTTGYLQTGDVEAQLSALVRTLVEHDVRFALLKGGGRLYGGDTRVRWEVVQDLDILVPRAELDVAREALFAAGYSWDFGAPDVSLFERFHHHLAALRLAGRGLSVEIHWALASPKSFGTQTQWGDLRDSLERVDGSGGTALRLDRFGSALHLLVHGIDAERLQDHVIVASYLREDGLLFDHLSAAVAREGRRGVELCGGLAIAARIAGIPAAFDRRVSDYVDWIFRREELPERQRKRAQFLDAWYANGGSLFGAANAALPRAASGERRWQQRVLTPIRLAGLRASGATDSPINVSGSLR